MRAVIEAVTGSQATFVCDTGRHDVELSLWRGPGALVPGMTVEVAFVDGKPASILPPAPAQGDPLAGAKRLGRGVLADVGKDVAIVYGVFAFVALFLPFLSSSGGLSGTLSISLSDAPALLEGRGDPAGRGTIIWVLLAIASIAVPHLWKHRFAPLALCLPALVTLYGLISYLRFRWSLGGLGELVPIGLGFGAWLCFAAAGYLAFRGVSRFRARPTGAHRRP